MFIMVQQHSAYAALSIPAYPHSLPAHYRASPLRVADFFYENCTSVFLGRAGIVSESTGYDEKLQTITGVEVPHLMATRKATYLRGGIMNWMSGFATITIARKCVTPQVIPMQPDGSFVYEGRIWG